jgi:hypothetical protein
MKREKKKKAGVREKIKIKSTHTFKVRFDYEDIFIN